MTDTATAEAPTAELNTEDSESTAKAHVIKEYTYGNAKVTLLGKAATSKSGEAFTKKFFAVEHFYRNEQAGKWESNHYFDDHQLSHLAMAIDDARRGTHDKTL